MHFITSIITGATVLISSWFGFSHHQVLQPVAAISTSTIAIDSATTAPKRIYLSFDMDMNEPMYQKIKSEGKVWYNPALFSYLEQNHIPATFFVSGLFAFAYPDLVRGLASSTDFAFENHSYDESSFVSNCYWLRTLTTDQQKQESIARTENIIKDDTGQTATYFRFPGACTNAQNNTLVESLGYTINDGTDIAGDPFNKNTNAIVHAVLTNARSGATVLMHVGGPNAPESLVVLKQVVPAFEAAGYKFEKL